MGKLHFDPVELDENWRRRHIYRWEPYGLIDQLVELRASFRGKRDSAPPAVEATLVDIEHALLASYRECDEIFDNLFYFTDADGWAARVEEMRQWGKVQHRIVVGCRVNKVGNLTVRFEPSFVATNGRVEHAPEWREMPYLGDARIGERPDNEVLYIRDVERLFRIGAHSAVRTDARYARLADLVTAAFWLTVHRLARRFEVFVLSYVARLTSDDGDIEHGLEIVDTRKDTARALGAFVANFQQVNGCEMTAFWRECKRAQATKGSWSDIVSKSLRVKGTPTQHLTPKVCRDLHDRLKQAFLLGAAREPRDTVVTEVAGTGWRVIESKEAIGKPLPSSPPARAIAEPSLLVEAKPYSTDSNPRRPMREAQLDAAIREEFGVSSAQELFGYANRQLSLLGRKPLAEGDYPSNKTSLQRLVKLLRGLPKET